MPGAGRPKKDRTSQAIFDDAESYLLAVVQGRTPPDSARITAAKTLIQYQQAKQRGPLKSPTPLQLHKKNISAIERNKLLKFEERAVLIRAKIRKNK